MPKPHKHRHPDPLAKAGQGNPIARPAPAPKADRNADHALMQVRADRKAHPRNADRVPKADPIKAGDASFRRSLR